MRTRITIRLYRPHDMDLIVLQRSNNYKLSTEIKKCLTAFARGEVYQAPSLAEEDMPTGYTAKSYQLHLDLNSKNEDEKKVINILAEIKSGFRCAFIKALFRNNCVNLPLLAYGIDNELVTSRQDMLAKTVSQISTSIYENLVANDNKDLATETKEKNVDEELPQVDNSSVNGKGIDDALIDIPKPVQVESPKVEPVIKPIEPTKNIDDYNIPDSVSVSIDDEPEFGKEVNADELSDFDKLFANINA